MLTKCWLFDAFFIFLFFFFRIFGSIFATDLPHGGRWRGRRTCIGPQYGSPWLSNPACPQGSANNELYNENIHHVKDAHTQSLRQPLAPTFLSFILGETAREGSGRWRYRRLWPPDTLRCNNPNDPPTPPPPSPHSCASSALAPLLCRSVLTDPHLRCAGYFQHSGDGSTLLSFKRPSHTHPQSPPG